MKTKELIEYLQGFHPEQEISVIVVGPQERMFYPVNCFGGITDMGYPVLTVEVTGGEPFDEELTAAAKEDEDDERQSDSGASRS